MGWLPGPGGLVEKSPTSEPGMARSTHQVVIESTAQLYNANMTKNYLLRKVIELLNCRYLYVSTRLIIFYP